MTAFNICSSNHFFKMDVFIRCLPILAFVLFPTFVAAETLEEIWTIATQVNHRLQAQGHKIQAAQEELREVRAARLPTLANRSGYVHLSAEPTFALDIPAMPPVLPTPVTLESPLADRSFAMSATTLTVPLYTGGKIQAGIDARRFLVQAEQAGLAAARQNLKLEVAEAYFHVLRARRLHEVTINAERSVFAHLENAKKLLEQNLVTKNVLLAAQAAWANTAQDVLKAENQVFIAEAALNRYLGRSLDFPVFVEEMDVPELSGELKTLTAEALRCRRELNQVAAQGRASSAASRVAQAERLPQVVAVGSHNYVQNSHLRQESLWSGGVGLAWTPFDGGASQARERAARQNAAAAFRIREETRSLIVLQVRAAWVTERETRNRIQVAELGKSLSVLLVVAVIAGGLVGCANAADIGRNKSLPRHIRRHHRHLASQTRRGLSQLAKRNGMPIDRFLHPSFSRRQGNSGDTVPGS